MDSLPRVPPGKPFLALLQQLADRSQKSESIAVAVLETMWGWDGSEESDTRYFRINENNFTGRRLYSFLGHHRLLVTNACRECVSSADRHGTPDADWLHENLLRLQTGFNIYSFLICGRVAQETFVRTQFEMKKEQQVCFIPHPAARCWTRVMLDYVKVALTRHEDFRFDFKDGLRPLTMENSNASDT